MQKMRKFFYISIVLLMSLLVSCSDFLEAEQDNTRDEDIFKETAYFTGPLNYAYDQLPRNFNTDMDVLTDNAVLREQSGNYYRASLGALSPNLNPLGTWAADYEIIRTLNVFLSNCVLDGSTKYRTPVRFFTLATETDYINNINYFYRLKGEAYGLRAYYLFDLLRDFGGRSVDGSMLGVPLVGNQILASTDVLDIPRATFEECVKAIVDDCDSALVVGKLPDLYGKENSGDVVYGSIFRDHISGAAVKALKARVLLYAASPAYNPDHDPAKWEAAAEAAAEAVSAAGGIDAAFSAREEYYFKQINNLNWKNYDVILRGRVSFGNNAFEIANFPPMLYGEAQVNVSQNFVDCFPDKDGYPISESVLYDPASPFTGRDARLALFVGYHGSKIGDYPLDIADGGVDAYRPDAKTSRSGYYLKKTLLETIRLTPGSSQGTTRANILFGLPEVFLNFAEAAVEAWGVSGDPQGNGFTAKDALLRIVNRDAMGQDKYLKNVIGDDRAKFLEYVRLQRRLELAFEGHYYYDLRRWYAGTPDWRNKINVPVYGGRIDKDGSFSTFELETRKYISAYPPIPYSEIYNAGLKQNEGWK